jgi:uncharacterized protein YbjT (DUF2867 family)
MILVTGATGLNGSAVIREFVRRGQTVRALVRDPAKAATLRSTPGVDVAVGDMGRPETLGRALDGVDRALMISTADAKLVDTQCAFIDAAKKAGVPHVVKFSAIGSRERAPSSFRFVRMHLEIERYLEGSGVAWTHICPSQFMHVYVREARTIASEGAFYLPLGGAKLAPIDVEDIARIAFAVLHADAQHGKRHEMTGPEALTMTEVAAHLSGALGKTVRYVDVDPARMRTAILAAGAPSAFADAMDELFAARRSGLSDESVVRLGAHDAFGIRPTTFLEFARRNREIFLGRGVPSHLWTAARQGAET